MYLSENSAFGHHRFNDKGKLAAIVFAETLLLLIELADQITENDCAVTGH